MTDLFGAAEVYGPDDRERWVHEPPKSRSRTDFERDRARVLHSSALRRLGAKTQVLGPESDDFVRTRLTHSLEVAQIGRSLAKNFGCDPDIVETACLCHDLGHPPFGHNGERALAEVGEEIGGFEGNAQTLRILTRLEPKRTTRTGRPAGLNLTRATLDAVIKYPWGNNEGPGGTPKFNYYRDDADVFEWIHGEHGHNRCVEAQIMDLADDIAYSVHDVEDAIARGFFDPSCLTDPGERQKVVADTLAWYGEPSAGELSDALDRLLREEAWPVHFGGNYRDFARMKDLTSDLIGRFVSAVCQATWAQSGHGKLVRYNGNVVVPPETFAEITVLKGIAVAYVMAPREHEPHYVEQRAIIFDLVEALLEKPEELEPHLAELWASSDKDARLRLVIDQVASLTDLSARQWHAHLCGMLRH